MEEEIYCLTHKKRKQQEEKYMVRLTQSNSISAGPGSNVKYEALFERGKKIDI